MRKLIKTWTNSWATSHRYHELLLLPCVMGCQDGKDDLSHYAGCIQINLILGDLFLTSRLGRLGLWNASRDSVLTCAAVFSAYHVI